MKEEIESLKERYYNAEGFKNNKKKHIEMIKKHHINYSENDWVLWIVPELNQGYNIKDLVATIKVKKNDGSFIDIPPFVVRTPYKDKNIYQISMKSGKKIIYGIPLIFKTFEELSQVSEVLIDWEIYSEGRCFLVNNVTVKYNLQFKKDDKNEDYHFFTIFSKEQSSDIVYTIGYYVSENEYFSEFDKASNVIGIIQKEAAASKFKIILAGIINTEETDLVGKYMLKDPDSKHFSSLRKILPNEEKLKQLKFIIDEYAQSDIFYNISCYEKTEVLTSRYMANIAAIPSSGFPNI